MGTINCREERARVNSRDRPESRRLLSWNLADLLAATAVTPHFTSQLSIKDADET